MLRALCFLPVLLTGGQDSNSDSDRDDVPEDFELEWADGAVPLPLTAHEASARALAESFGGTSIETSLWIVEGLPGGRRASNPPSWK